MNLKVQRKQLFLFFFCKLILIASTNKSKHIFAAHQARANGKSFAERIFKRDIQLCPLHCNLEIHSIEGKPI